MPRLEDAIRLHRGGDLAKAASLYRKILKRCPQQADALHLLGCVELSWGNRDRAVDLMREAIRVSPEVALYHENLAEAHHRSGRPREAEAECRLALRFDPKRHRARNRLGILAMERGDYGQAQAEIQAALRLCPTSVESLSDLATVLNRTGAFPTALEATDLALRLAPGNPLVWNSRGLAFKGLGRRAKAREAFARAGEFVPARFNLGYMHMLEDDLERGLPLCESRLSAARSGGRLRGREWKGRDHPRQRLLVLHEQGLGDTVLVSRFIPALRERFASVAVLVQEPLAPLLAGLVPGVEIVTDRRGLRYDRWAWSMSLPHLLRIRRIEEVPVAPWIPGATPRAGGPLRAGINWAGNPRFHFDRIRSTTLDTLRPLLGLPGVEWVSLHKGAREHEAEALGLSQPLRDARDFRDTARTIGELDLVVSTETAVPNLSAAMGVPTVLLAAVDHDWRWRSWYRDVELCSQDEVGRWKGAVEKAVKAVSRLGERLRPAPRAA